jgi:hypothetical protein
MITQSALKKYQQCEQMYKFRYVDGYREIIRSDALLLGTIVHAGLESFLHGESITSAIANMQRVAYEKEKLSPCDLVVDQSEIILEGYYKKYFEKHHKQYDTVAVESEFMVEVEGMWFGGKIDGLIKEKGTGDYILIEHKTSGDRTATGVGGTYWKQLEGGMDMQLILYQEAVRVAYSPDKGPPRILYDVLYKNKQKMKDLLDMRVYYGSTYAPFYRKELYYTPKERHRSLWELGTQAKRIAQREKDGNWTRSTSRCRSGFGLCPYFDVCQGASSLELSTNLERMDDLHPELEGNCTMQKEKE